jgi:hypothetical protein
MILRRTLVTCALAFCAQAMADTAVTVDAKRNCVTTGTTPMKGPGAASTPISTGRYVASLINNSMTCISGANCPIDTVIIQAAGNAASTSVTWGLAVKTGVPVVFDVSESGLTLAALVIDSYCADNAGSATLLLQPVN